jgi:hypothetical protein
MSIFSNIDVVGIPISTLIDHHILSSAFDKWQKGVGNKIEKIKLQNKWLPHVMGHSHLRGLGLERA